MQDTHGINSFYSNPLYKNLRGTEFDQSYRYNPAPDSGDNHTCHHFNHVAPYHRGCLVTIL